MKKSTLLTAVLASALLQACGGGGGGDTVATAPTGSTADGNGATTTQPAPGSGTSSNGNGGSTTTQPAASGDQGSISAPFAVTAAGLSRYMIFSPNGSSFGGLTATSQAASGAITSLTNTSRSTTLSGSSVTKDIAGDASYALGRWVTGTVTDPSGAVVLTGADGGSYHYAAYDMLASFPATGAYACALQSSTTPTLVSGSGSSTGAVNGALGLNFDDTVANDTVANLNGSMTITVGNETVTAGVPSSIPNPATFSATGQFYASNTGTAVQVADAGGGNYALMVAYAAKFASGALYHGIARMSCTAN